MIFPPVIFFFLVLLLALPALALFGFFHIAKLGFGALGISPGFALLILLLMLAGSRINIPLTRPRVVEVQEPAMFGFSRRRKAFQGVFLNVGGGLIPLILAAALLPGLPLIATLVASLLMILVANRLARRIPKRGISIPMLLCALLAAFFATLIAPEHAAPVAFVSGVVGLLVGADLLKVPGVLEREAGMISIGGAGVFDGIVLVSVLSAFLASI